MIGNHRSPLAWFCLCPFALVACLGYRTPMSDLGTKPDAATGTDSATANNSDAVRDTVRCTGAWTFAPQKTYAAKGVPFAIAVGDFNRDGHPDLAFANYGTPGAAGLLFNTGDGTFGEAVSYPVGNSPESIAVGDFNGDGAPDLVVSNIDDNTISVLLNIGRGAFRSQVTYAAGRSPNTVTVGDFNLDGAPDIAVVGEDLQDNLRLYFNAGGGAFGVPVTYSQNYWPSGVVVADFNRDGLPDLAYANPGQGTVNVLLNNGGGIFGAGQTYTETAYADTGSIAVGDFNGDGFPDLVLANNFMAGNVIVMINAGNGTFGAQVTYATGPDAGIGNYGGSVAVGDFNGDGHPDIAVTNDAATNVGVLLNSGDGTFGAQTTYAAGLAGYNFAAIVTGDFNGDGVDDIVTANGWNYSVSVLLSQCR